MSTKVRHLWQHKSWHGEVGEGQSRPKVPLDQRGLKPIASARWNYLPQSTTQFRGRARKMCVCVCVCVCGVRSDNDEKKGR